MPRTEVCKTCHFYVPSTERFGGDCKRFPETMQKGENDWCGEWKLKQKAPAKPK